MPEVAMTLTDDDVRNAEALREFLHKPTKAETVKTALKITRRLSEVIQNHGEVIVKRQDGSTQRLIIADI